MFHILRSGFVTLSLLLWAWAAAAASITVTVTDDAGRPVPDAVVTVTAPAGTPAPPLGGSRLATATINQLDEVFVPSVVVIRTGGTVTFRNSDAIRHHVYSFKQTRRFEMVQQPGETSQPMVFDKPGAVAIGCNIHDHMTAYVLVTDAPWAQVTDATGTALIDDLPPGQVVASVWHPRLRPASDPPAHALTLETAASALAVTIPILPPRRPRAREY